MKTPNRDALVAAQFMLKGKLYVEWAWQERMREHPDSRRATLAPDQRRVVFQFQGGSQDEDKVVVLNSRRPG